MAETPSEHPAVAGLDEHERERVAQRTALGARVVHEAIRMEGETELVRPLSSLGWSAVAAGLSMGFSLTAEGLLRASLPERSWSVLVAKLGYTVGFLVVILARQQLFTENTLTGVLPLLHRPSASTFARVARLWAVVLVGNVLGAYAFALLASGDTLFEPHTKAQFALMGREAFDPGFYRILIRGIFGGWLIALTVWMLPAAGGAKVPVIVIVTYLVGLGHFSHSIAGSVEVLFLVTSGALSFGSFLAGFLLPAFLGNSVGGVALVAVLNHAQVRGEIASR